MAPIAKLSQRKREALARLGIVISVLDQEPTTAADVELALQHLAQLTDELACIRYHLVAAEKQARLEASATPRPPLLPAQQPTSGRDGVRSAGRDSAGRKSDEGMASVRRPLVGTAWGAPRG